MKVARIDHHRCDEIAGTTYVWVPDDITQDQFHAAIDRAEERYMAFLKEWKVTKELHNPGWGGPDYKNADPNKTVGEIKAEYDAKLAEYKAFEKKQSQAYRTFEYYLKDEGFRPLWDYKPDMFTTIYWGHNHGMSIDYSETKLNDLPGPLTSKEDDW